MSKVYSSSFCNISAAIAPDGEHSIFGSRHPGALSPDDSMKDGITQRSLVYDLDFREQEVSSARINTRA